MEQEIRYCQNEFCNNILMSYHRKYCSNKCKYRYGTLGKKIVNRKKTLKECQNCKQQITLNLFQRHYDACLKRTQCLKPCNFCGKLTQNRKYCNNICGSSDVSEETKLKRLNTRIQTTEKNGYWHSKETKEKIGKAHMGISETEKTKKILSKAHIGKVMSAEQCKNISIALRNSEKFGNVDWSGILQKRWDSGQMKGMTGKKTSDETKRKQRIAALENIAKLGHIRVQIGRNEPRLLNEQEKTDICKIKRSYHIKNLGYIGDGYCVETNIWYEVYESGHKNKKILLRDLQRQKEIQEYLKCKFVIIWDLPEGKIIERK